MDAIESGAGLAAALKAFDHIEKQHDLIIPRRTDYPHGRERGVVRKKGGNECVVVQPLLDDPVPSFRRVLEEK